MTAERRPAPWRGKRKVPDPRVRFIAVRCKPEEHAGITAAAAQAGLSVGAFLRAAALGSTGNRARRRPQLERKALAQVLGLIGRIGGNINQLAVIANTNGVLPRESQLLEISRDIRTMRAALMEALGRGDNHQG